MKVLPRGDRQSVEGILQVLPGIDAELLAGLGEAGQDHQGPAAISDLLLTPTITRGAGSRITVLD